MWAGIDCSIPVSPFLLLQKKTITLTPPGTTVSLTEDPGGSLRVTLTPPQSDLRICFLEAAGAYWVPGKDYWSWCGQWQDGEADLSVVVEGRVPVYLSLFTSRPIANATFTFHPDSSSSSDSLKDFSIVVCLTVPIVVVLVVLSVLSIYIRQARRRRRIIPNVRAQNRTLPDCGPQDLEVIKTALFECIEPKYHTECPICLDTFTADTWVRQLACGHAYHTLCLESLVTRQHICSICKRPFDVHSCFSLLNTQTDVSPV